MPENIKTYGLWNDEPRNSPEHRLWTAVLITFIDELIEKTNQLDDAKRKLNSNPQNKEYFQFAIEHIERSILILTQTCRCQGTKNICQMIGIDHRWFYQNIEKIAKDKKMKSRPIRQLQGDI